MIQKIPVHQLKKGMYIHDLNHPALTHPYFSTHRQLVDEKDLRWVRDLGVGEVYIDTSRDIQPIEGPATSSSIMDLRAKAAELPWSGKGVGKGSCPDEEAILSFHQAQSYMKNLMGDLRLGRRVALERLEPVVECLADSLFGETDVLLHLGRVRTKDDYTFSHSVAVCGLMLSFCDSLGLGREISLQIGNGALLHDVGKMFVPEEILNKPASLSKQEFEVMKRHVEHGVTFLESKGKTVLNEISLGIVRDHHKRYDGGGYPEGQRNGQISQFGQMAAIADVYDAITSDRVYHLGISPAEAIGSMIEWGQGGQFNPDLLAHFVRIVGIYPVGSLVRLNDGLLAVVVEQRKDLLRPKVRVIKDIHKNSFFEPFDIDLSTPAGEDEVFKLIGYEQPEVWGINPGRVLECYEG